MSGLEIERKFLIDALRKNKKSEEQEDNDEKE